MPMNGILLLLIVVLLTLSFVKPVTDAFNTVPYNSFEVPENKQDNLFQAETKRLEELLATVNRDVLPEYRTTYTKHPSYSRFKHNEIFKNFLLQIINQVLKRDPYYVKSKFVFIRDIYNLYWKDTNQSINNEQTTTRHFIFNVDLNDRIKALSRKLKVYITVANINKYLDNGNFSDLGIAWDDISLQYLGTDNALTNFTIPPNSADLNSYYRTKNTLFLLDPFVTSGKDMRITDSLKVKFDQRLKQKEQEEKILSKGGFCFDSTAVTATNQIECLEAGGVWDYPPIDNMECPFYLANQNYNNNFGGIRQEKCELPRNMKNIGYRNYRPEILPLCYNCSNNLIDVGSLGYCCDEQKNKALYPQLITPDYAFLGDSEKRRRFADILAARGLRLE